MFGFLVCVSLLGEVTEAELPVDASSYLNQVETAARRYRISVYDAYRTDRPTYDERIAQANEVLELANKLPKRSVEHTKLLTWFQAATETVGVEESIVPDVPEVTVEDELFVEAEAGEETPSSFTTAPSAWQARPESSTETGPADEPRAEIEADDPAAAGPISAALKSLGGLLGNGETPSSAPVTEVPTAPEPPRPGEFVPATDSTSDLEPESDDVGQAENRYETLPTEAQGQAQSDLADLQQDLQQLRTDLEAEGPLRYQEAMTLLMRVTAIDSGQAGAKLQLNASGQNVASPPQETTQLLQKLRDRVAGQQFDGSPAERKDILTKIDALVQLRSSN